MEHWYVYYKCPGAIRDDAINRVRAMQASLAASSGTGGRLVQSADAGDTATMMEIYEHIDDAERFAAALDDALVRSGLPAELRAARRVERFRDT